MIAYIYTIAGDAVGVAGSGIQLASDYVPDEIGQSKCIVLTKVVNLLYIAAVYTAGGIIKDQGTADTDASIAERLAIGVGKDLSQKLTNYSNVLKRSLLDLISVIKA